MIPVVLLSAFPLSSAMYAAVDLPGLLTPDVAGFGSSPVPAGPPSLDALADDVVAELDRLGHDRVILGGVSMGGYVAMALMRRYAHRVAGLLLADTKADADTPEAVQNRLTMADSVLAGGDDAAELPAKMLVPGSPHLADLTATVRRARPEAVAWAQRAMAARPDSYDVLATVAVPALVLVGELDLMTPPSLALRMVEALPDADLAVIPLAAHLPPLESPQLFTAALRSLIARVEA